MTWDVICHVLAPFHPVQTVNTRFVQGEKLLLLTDEAADLPNTVYVTDGGADSPAFHHALIVSAGPCRVAADHLSEQEQGDVEATRSCSVMPSLYLLAPAVWRLTI